MTIEDYCKCAGVILYRTRFGVIEFLLVENAKQKMYQYSFPKGKRDVINGTLESTLDAAIRETREETGQTLQDYTLDTTRWFIEYLKFRKPHIVYYLAEIKNGDATITPECPKEILGHKWVSSDQYNNDNRELTSQRKSILNKVLLLLE